MFLHNSFKGVMPELDLQQAEKQLIALVCRELTAYMGLLEKSKCVFLCQSRVFVKKYFCYTFSYKLFHKILCR